MATVVPMTMVRLHFAYGDYNKCFNERRERRKKQANNKATQHSTPKAVTFPEKYELPWVGHVHVYVLHMYY